MGVKSWEGVVSAGACEVRGGVGMVSGGTRSWVGVVSGGTRGWVSVDLVSIVSGGTGEVTSWVGWWD